MGFSSILTTVLSASRSSGFLSADRTKSSVRMSSTRRSSPVSSCIREPFAKFPGTVLLFVLSVGFVGVEGGDNVLAMRFLDEARLSPGGRVKMRCFREPSLPLGTLKLAIFCFSFRMLWPGFTCAEVMVAVGLKAVDGGMKVAVAGLLGVAGVVGCGGLYVSRGLNGGGWTKGERMSGE